MHRIHVIVLSTCVAAHALHAQASADTSTAFRPGQWGVDFIPNRNLTEGGVLRFSTPTQAWVLDGSASFDHQTASTSGGFSSDQSAHSATVAARFGPRWYHGEYERVVRFAGFGVTGGYSSNSQSFGTSSTRQELWVAGVYGELGLQYLFTRHLGLGVRGDVVGSRTGTQATQDQAGNTTQHTTTYHVALEPLQLIGSFYF